jgi:serine protease AprX
MHNMAQITINGVSLDPIRQREELRRAGLVSMDASASDYILIQTTAPLTRNQTDELAKLGVVVQEYVSPNTYLCSYKGTDLRSIRTLPFMTWADIYLRGFKPESGVELVTGDDA